MHKSDRGSPYTFSVTIGSLEAAWALCLMGFHLLAGCRSLVLSSNVQAGCDPQGVEVLSERMEGGSGHVHCWCGRRQAKS